MQFGLVGINYKNAQLNIRDKTAFTNDRKLAFFRKAERVGVEQCMILYTCNRSEIYFIYKEPGQMEQIKKIYEEMFLDVPLKDYITALTGEDAMAYLFRIAAGLESLVFGEDQILGQVKEALDEARTMGYSGKELNKIVRDAVTCAKKVKTEFKISQKPLSVSYIGIRKLEEFCGISGKRILVIGSGKTVSLALQYIYEYPEVCVAACSRTYANAKHLREQFPGIAVIPYEKWRQVIKDCDIVISATSAPHLIIKREEFTPVKQTVFLDLAAPRDIDTAYEKEPLVHLINLDTLQKFAGENQKERERLAEESKKVMEGALLETMRWFHQSRMDGTIESLQKRCNAIVEDGFDYLNRKIELGEREQKLVKKVLNASLQRLLREPIHELKQLECEEDQEEYKQLVRRLFQI